MIEKKDKIRILGIESSCDETAAAVVEDGRRVISNIISSQIDIHTVYGGVVPEIASRLHCQNINGVIKLSLKEAGLGFEDIDAIAVTAGPGLVGALLIGVSEAKALAYVLRKPLIAVHHIEGHVAANYISHPELEPPYVCLIVSGGHTNLCIVKDFESYEIIGKSVDDAAGEAYDKVARAVGLGYPGGPKVDKAAKDGDPHAIELPLGEVSGRPYDFTFSGLKSAALNHINRIRMMGGTVNVSDLAASFQYAVVTSLVERTIACAKEFGFRKVAMAGGVSANSGLRAAMQFACEREGMSCYYPEPIYCTDNGAMIAAAAYPKFLRGDFADLSLNAAPDLRLSGSLRR